MLNMQKYIAVILTMLIAIGAPTTVGATGIAVPTCTFSSDAADYRFQSPDETVIYLTVKNNDTEAREFTLSYEVIDLSGASVWNGSGETPDINPEKTRKVSITPELEDYGEYTLDVTAADSEGTTYPYRLEFSFVPQCSITTEYAGNIFTDSSEIKIFCKLKNTASVAHNFSVSYEITDEKGSRIFAESEELLQNTGDLNEKTFMPTITKFGIYTFKAVITDDKNRTYSYEKEFSYVNAYRGNEKKEKCGMTVRMLSVGSPDVDMSMQITDNLGVGSINDGVRWYEYEQSKGVYGLSATKQARLDKEIAYALENGVELMVCFHGDNPDIYNTSDKIPRDAEALTALENAAKSFASEYAGKIEKFSFTNEPDLSRRQDVLSCEDFAKALNHFSRGIKTGNPDAKVIGFNVSQINTAWIEGVIKAGGAEYIDAVSIHPYQGPGSPESLKWVDMVNTVRDMLNRNNLSHLEIIGTEGNSPSSKAYNTELQQGFNLVRTYALAEAANCLDKFLPHQLFSLVQSSDDENGYGIIRSWGDPYNPYAAKSAYLQVCNFSALTIGKENKGMTVSDGVYIHHYEDTDGDDVLMMYADGDVKEISLKINADSGKMYDMYGNCEEINAIGGKYTFVLSDTPTYFEGSFTSAEVCEGAVKLDGTFFEITQGSSENVEIKLDNISDYTFQAVAPDTISAVVSVSGETAVLNMKVNSIPEKFHFTAKRQMYGTQEYRDYVNVYVKKDGKVYAKLPIAVDYLEKSADVSMFVREKTDAQTTAKWECVVTVRNNKSDENLSGTITFSRPTSVKNISFTASDIAPHTEKTYVFDLPESLNASYIWCVGNLASDDGENIEFQLGGHPRSYYYSSGQWTRVPPLSAIKYIKNESLTIDGVIEDGEWEENFLVEFDESVENDSTSSDEQRPDDTGDSEDYTDTVLSDFSGKIYATWDREFLYVAANVSDSIHNQSEVPAQMSRSDCINITVMNTTLQSQNSKFVVGLSDFGGESKTVMNTCWSTVPGQPYKGEIEQGADGAAASVIRGNGETVYEAKIPWTRLLGRKAVADDNFKLTLGVNDYDTKDISSKSYSFTRWTCLTDRQRSGTSLTDANGSAIKNAADLKEGDTINVKTYVPDYAKDYNLYLAQYLKNELVSVKTVENTKQGLLYSDYEACEESGSVSVTGDNVNLSTTVSNKNRLAVNETDGNKYLYYKTEGFDSAGVQSKPGYILSFAEDITEGLVNVSFDIGRGETDGGSFTNASNVTTKDFMLVRDNTSSGRRWFFYASSSEGLMCSGQDNTAAEDTSSYKAYEKNEIYHVDIVFDRDNGKQITFIDGEKINDMPYEKALNTAGMAFFISWSVGYFDNLCVTQLPASGKTEITYDDIKAQSFTSQAEKNIDKIKVFGFGKENLEPIIKEYILD